MCLPCYVKAKTKVEYGVADTCRKHKTYVHVIIARNVTCAHFLVSNSNESHLETRHYNYDAK